MTTIALGAAAPTPSFSPDPDRVSHILRSIVRAIEFADQYAGDTQAVSEWLCLIEAAANTAHYLLEGQTVEQGWRGEA